MRCRLLPLERLKFPTHRIQVVVVLFQRFPAFQRLLRPQRLLQDALFLLAQFVESDSFLLVDSTQRIVAFLQGSSSAEAHQGP